MTAHRPSARRRRTLAVVLVGLLSGVLAGALAPALAAPASAAGAPTASTSAVATADADPIRFGDDAVRPATTASARASYAWRGSRLYVRETLPSQWDWSLRTALAKWNASGSGIRMVLTSDRRRAQVTVSHADTGAAAGLATVGRVRGAFVELSARYAEADATDAHTRVEVMSVLAHELGHVLGFDHTTTACSLMGPVLDVAGCGVVAPDQPGTYTCRTIDAPLVARLVRLYGGSSRLASAGRCLIDPLPGTLTGVSVGFEDDGDLAVTWRPPSTVPTGAGVAITHWDGDCSSVPTGAGHELSPAPSGRWARPATEVGDCLTVGLVNRYGLARSLTGATVSAGAVVVAPLTPATAMGAVSAVTPAVP